MNEAQDYEVLPCGCTIEKKIVDGVRALVYARCSASCVNYRNMMDLARSEGKPIETRTEL